MPGTLSCIIVSEEYPIRANGNGIQKVRPIIYNNSETFVFAGSSSIVNSGLIFNPLQVYCGGIISLVKAELLQLRF
jgi:hypothetical protein